MRCTKLLAGFFLAALPLAAQNAENDRARIGGPDAGELRRLAAHSPHELLALMFNAVDRFWFVNEYEQAKHAIFRARVNANLPVSALNSKLNSSGETLDFDLDIEGIATPNGQHRIKLEGGLGEVELINDLKRRFMAGQSFKTFSDTPIRDRSKNANLASYRGYLRRHVTLLRKKIMDSGVYRAAYAGTGVHRGLDVHVVRFYKPRLKRKPDRRTPIPMRKLWTFWQDGGYEIWIYRHNNLPAVVFYTNNDDNIYANFSFEYDQDNLPKRIVFKNNSFNAEGSGDVVLHYDREKMLSGISLKFDGEKGVSLRLDATLVFGGEPPLNAFRILPPFGFKKVNRDHLKLMVLTQISGGLLKLKKHGINLKNFKF